MTVVHILSSSIFKDSNLKGETKVRGAESLSLAVDCPNQVEAVLYIIAAYYSALKRYHCVLLVRSDVDIADPIILRDYI